MEIRLKTPPPKIRSYTPAGIQDAVENFTGLESAGDGGASFLSASAGSPQGPELLIAAEERAGPPGMTEPAELAAERAAFFPGEVLSVAETPPPPEGRPLRPSEGRSAPTGAPAEATGGAAPNAPPAPVQPAPSRTPLRDAEAAPSEALRLEAVIFGYLASVEGEVRTLLLAAPGPDGRPRYVGKLTREALSESQWRSLAEELPTRRVARPLVACPHHGQWVEPHTFLGIEFDRWSAAGFVNPRVTSIERRAGGGRR